MADSLATKGQSGAEPAEPAEPTSTPDGQKVEGAESGDRVVEPSWRDQLPPDLKDSDALAKFKDIPSLAKSHIELEKAYGGTVKLPSDTSKPEEWQQFYNRLGRPENPDGYQLETVEGIAEEGITSFRQEAHKLGLTQAQADGLMKFYGQSVIEPMKQNMWTAERGAAELQNEWKDSYAQNLTKVTKLVGEYGDDELVEVLDSTGLGNHPAVNRFLAKIGGLFTEDEPPADNGGGSAQLGMSPDEAKARIAAIRNDKDHPYHKGDRVAVAEMANLYGSAYGRKIVTEVG